MMEIKEREFVRRSAKRGGGICVAMLIATTLCSGCNGQAGILGTDWLKGLTQSIEALNRNIQENVQQVNRRVQETVQGNLQQVRRLTDNLNEELASGNVQIIGGGGNNVLLSSNGETKIVQSGRTSDGKPFVREITEKVVGDTLRHAERIYDPATNTSKLYGYTLDLKDPHAKPVTINDAA